jgi:murein DD-endopeptidase MepM/ murein hydrolase activator NlpD
VILARPLYFEGNCVVIDHGQGLLSLYLHLSEFKVKEGEEVETGQLIGLSGGTGRATGPHLHLAIRWQSVYLNPQLLLKLRLAVKPSRD